MRLLDSSVVLASMHEAEPHHEACSALPVTLTERDVMAALAQAQSRGVRGGAVYDYLHLVAARKSGAEVLVTLDSKHFAALAREGDPRVEGV